MTIGATPTPERDVSSRTITTEESGRRRTATVQAAMAPKTAANDRPPSLLLADAASGDRDYVQAVRLINQGRYDDALVALKKKLGGG